MKKEPFSLEKWQEHCNRRLITAQGHVCRIIRTDLVCEYPIIAEIHRNNLIDHCLYDKEGHCKSDPSLDIFFVATELTGLSIKEEKIQKAMDIYGSEVKQFLNEVGHDAFSQDEMENHSVIAILCLFDNWKEKNKNCKP